MTEKQQEQERRLDSNQVNPKSEQLATHPEKKNTRVNSGEIGYTNAKEIRYTKADELYE